MFFNLPTDLLTHPGFWTISKWFIFAFFAFAFFHFLHLHYIMKANEEAQKADHREHNILLRKINELDRIVRIQKGIPIRKQRIVPKRR